MFELIIFWCWVSIFTYSTLIVPWLVVIGGIWKYVEYQLKYAQLEFDVRNAINRKFHTLYTWPSAWLTKFLGDACPSIIVISAILGGVLWASALLHQTNSEAATGVVPDLIAIISKVSILLATYTSWVVIPLFLLIGFHLGFRKVINIVVSLKTKLDSLT